MKCTLDHVIVWHCQCPETEPDLSLNLRVCHPCSERIQHRQITEYRENQQHVANRDANDEEVKRGDTWEKISRVNEDLQIVQGKVEEYLPKVKF